MVSRARWGTATAAAIVVAAALAGPAVAAPTTHVVDALGTRWDPDAVAAVQGDTVEWRWVENVHDLWLVDADVPLGAEAGAEEKVTDLRFPGDPPDRRTFADAGAWDFYCKIHGGRGPEPAKMSGTIAVAEAPEDRVAPVTTAALDPAVPGAGGTYTGPVTVTLSATDEGGSGVAGTRVRLDGGPEQEYDGPITVSAAGAHTLAYASTDQAGNAEAERQLTFTITSGGGDPDPSATVLLYSGTTGYRHAGGSEAIQPEVVELIQDRLAAAGIESDYRTCNGQGAGGGALPGCRNPDVGNPAIFTPANLAQYDAIFFWQASSAFRGDTTGQRLFTDGEQAAIEDFVHDGGGIAAMHASVTMGAGQVTWPWWDAPGNSAIGALMPGHSATDANNVATVQVADRHHPSTRELPDSYEFGDEHYTFSSNVRGTHHVLMTLDEESYDVGAGVTRMGADHPIAWCRMYEGGRIWTSSLGHFSAAYLENGGDNELMKHLVGGVAWAAGTAGEDSDCGGTVWSNFSRTVLTDDLRGAIGLDIARDGKVYWTEIGDQGLASEGRLRMYDPETDETSTLLTLQTRADHTSSNDGVLGMALDPRFEQNRRLYVYYSPRQDPGCNSCIHVGHNVISRFTLDAAGTAVVPGSEQEILRVPKVKVGNDNQDGVPGQNTYSAHVGGGSLTFDSDGDLYVGTGDDVDPFGQGGSGYAPLDQRYPERYDARNTSADTSDLRGKVLRIRPLANADGTAGAGTTYAIPAGNMFAPGTEGTKPEIYAMGFRNPFTVQADPREPGTVVVGDYGPDAGANSATRGPAGVVEWNRVTKPGFYGWPFCAGDNSPANSYFRYAFPSGPSGERFDCSAAEIPNESPNHGGLDDIPGPAVAADVWHKRTGEHPARFAIPVQGSPQESITGPVYDFDADNPSDTKWPAYYDGSWLILDRAQNWWREARITDDGNALLRVNSMFGSSQFGSPSHSFPIPVKFGPDGSLYLATWGIDCCRSGLPGSAPGRLMRIDYTGDQQDVAGPEVEATVEGGRDAAGAYVGRATLTLDATDTSGVASVEYSLDGGETWEAYDEPVAFTERGDYTVQFRATDRATPPNTSAVEQVTFTVVSGGSCLPQLSDEFDGEALDTARWTYRHATTPATGTGAPGVTGGSLSLPLGGYSVDLTRPGPIDFLGQQLPEGDFVLETKITAPGLDTDTGGQGSQYAQVGLKLFQTNDNWVKVSHTRNADGSPAGSANSYFELAYETNGTRTLGTRFGLAGPATNLPTWWMRVIRSGTALSGEYSLTDPEGPGGATWITLGTIPNLDQVLPPAAGARYIGLYGGNGSVSASYDYVRLTPDRPVDAAAPETSHEVAPAPGAGGWNRGAVAVTLSAEDQGGCVSGVAMTEYRIGAGEWTPYAAPIAVAGDGVHVVEYRSADARGNVETPRTVSVRIDGTAPQTTAQLSPASPGAGGTYTVPVTVTLAASDAGSGVAGTEYRIDGGGWTAYAGSAPPRVSAAGSHTVEYRSTDAAGNLEAGKSVAFSIEDDGTGSPGAPLVQAFADPASGPAPLPVRLSATALDPDGGEVTYRWQVEDGVVLGANAVYTFRRPGVHEAIVTVTDDEGETASETVQVTVTDPAEGNQPPTVEASVDEPTGAAPHRVRFDASGSDPDGRSAELIYQWEFGDGGESLARRPGHTYGEPGTYTATVTVTDVHGGQATAEVVVEVTNPPGNRAPTVEAAALPRSGMAPLSSLLSAQGTDPDGDRLTYGWEFGDGQSGEGRVLRHVYLLGGTYAATVTATDEHGESATADVEIVVGNPAGNQAPSVQVAADPATGRAPLLVRFSSAASDPDGDQLLHVWEFGDGGMGGGPRVAHRYAAAGTYTAKLTVTDPHGASASQTMTVVVSAAHRAGDVAGARAGRIAAVGRPKSVAAFRRRGLRVSLTCSERLRGKATLRVSRRAARRLGLDRRTLASRTVACRAGDSVRLRLKPRRDVRRQLATTSPGTLQVTLRVAVDGGRDLVRRITIRTRR